MLKSPYTPLDSAHRAHIVMWLWLKLTWEEFWSSSNMANWVNCGNIQQQTQRCYILQQTSFTCIGDQEDKGIIKPKDRELNPKWVRWFVGFASKVQSERSWFMSQTPPVLYVRILCIQWHIGKGVYIYR